MFVGNHRSNFDPIIEWLVLKPWDIAFISKGENFKIPFFRTNYSEMLLYADRPGEPAKGIEDDQ